MTTNEFKEYVKTRQALNTEEIHRFMDEMSSEARRITLRLNTAYYTPDEVRELLSELFGYQVPSSFRVFPPFYADFGKNITVGEGVFINACCHFQDHGGVIIGDGCQIGHNVVLITHLQVQLLLLSLHQLNNQEYERCNLFTCFYLRPRLQQADQRIKGICPIYGDRDNPCL